MRSSVGHDYARVQKSEVFNMTDAAIVEDFAVCQRY